jgi:hypothetical protein
MLNVLIKHKASGTGHQTAGEGSKDAKRGSGSGCASQRESKSATLL